MKAIATTANSMNRRGFLLGLGASLIAAPAIVRAGSLMPVRAIVQPILAVAPAAAHASSSSSPFRWRRGKSFATSEFR